MCYLTQDIELLGTSPSPMKRSSPPLRAKTNKSLPFKKRRQVIKKSVCFSLHQNNIKVRHASPDDLRRAWHSRGDYQAMEASARESVIQAALTQQEPEGFTLRGLEATVSEKVREQRKKWIGTTVGGVLLVQSLQKSVGVANAGLLKEMSMKGSAQSRMCSLMMGALDSEEAK